MDLKEEARDLLLRHVRPILDAPASIEGDTATYREQKMQYAVELIEQVAQMLTMEEPRVTE